MAYDVNTYSPPCGARRKTTPSTKGPGVPKGESGGIPGPRIFCTEWCSSGLSGMLVRLMLLLMVLLVDLNRGAAESGGGLTILERLIVGGRCQARCNAKYGYQERHRQIDLFDHYMPYTCAPDNHFNCTQCSKACLGNNYYPTKCKQHCQSDVCKESCDFLNDAFREESEKPGGPSVPAGNLTQAASSLTLTKPKVICTYTDMKALAADPRSLVRVYWNVRDVTNVSTSLPLTFVIAIQKCADVTDCPKSSTWRFFGKTTNFSVIPVYDLQPDSIYVVKVVAVHWSGYIPGSAESDLIITPPVRDTLGTPVGLTVSKQYVRAGNLHAVVSWKAPPDTGGCYFRLYSMPPRGTYEMIEIKYWGQLKYELKKLTFNSNYTIQVYNSDENFLLYSQPENITFHTLESCLKATDYDYNLCPPERPANVKLSHSVPYVLNNTEQQLCDITVSWDPPQFRRYRNFVVNYSLSFRKAPDMFIADIIQPHRGSVTLPSWATNYTIRRCHWDGIYEVTVKANSKGGTSLDFTDSITLGSGYAEYYDGAEPEAEGKAVLYATLAPALLGFIAVAVCLCYRWRISSTKSVLIGEVLRREEINPIYECAVGKEEAQLLLPDEYEINPDSLHFTEVIGEGAFGKVVKAHLDLSLAHMGGRSSGSKVVAVKILKEHATPDEHRNLMLEIEAMKQLGQHQSIVSIIACVTGSQRPCLVMHYCPLGDLRSFLRNNRLKQKGSSSTDTSNSSGRRGQLNSGDSGISYASKTSNSFSAHRESAQIALNSDEACGAVGGVDPFTESVSTESSDNSAMFADGDNEVLSQTKLLSFARQIAMGMEYLAQRKFIHRDLAARNILLYNHRQLKISDFGLARDVYETCMYQPTSARKLPYKWMAIESIFDQIFTIKSDVWSFGIVLWEIVTLGGCPYPGIPNKDLFRLLKEGYRMEKPENCSLEIYKMMLSCWHPRPEDRPSFTELRNTLECSLEKAQSYIDLSVNVSEDYYKQDSECSNNNSAPFGATRMSGEDYGGLEMMPAVDDHGYNVNSTTSISAAADVHVCQLFHNNSADKNLTLGLAESVTLEGPTSEPENTPCSTPTRKNAEGSETRSESSANTAFPSPDSGDLGRRRRKRKEGREGEETLVKDGKILKSKVFFRRGLDEVTFEGVEEEEQGEAGGEGGRRRRGESQDGEEEKDDDTFALNHRGGMHSEPLLPTSPRSASGSSSTELTCDCDSPYNLSDTSLTSASSNHVKVHHAPSLTYGVLSLFRTGRGSGLRKGQGRQKRQSQSLTDVSRLEMEPELAQHTCAYERRTDGWACAL